MEEEEREHQSTKKEDFAISNESYQVDDIESRIVVTCSWPSPLLLREL